MREYELKSPTGETVKMQLREGWQDVTLSEFIEMQGLTDVGRLSYLTGLSETHLLSLDSVTAEFIAGMLGFMPEPVTGLKLLSETIGQLETAKQHLRNMADRHPDNYEAHAAPLIYGLYKAEPVNGKWEGKASQALAKEALALPVTEVWPFVQGCYLELQKIATRYAGLTESDEEDEDDEQENELATFGFYPTLKALAGGDILKHDAILQLSAITVYTDLVFRKKEAEVMKRKRELEKQGA